MNIILLLVVLPVLLFLAYGAWLAIQDKSEKGRSLRDESLSHFKSVH